MYFLPKMFKYSFNAQSQTPKGWNILEMKSAAMVSSWTNIHIFDAKHIKYLQSKPGKTIFSL